jgi:hypothetical protein
LNQTNHFFDLGYGWLCKHCSAEDAEQTQDPKIPTESQNHGLPLAGWTDSSRQALTCPRCGIEEAIQNT